MNLDREQVTAAELAGCQFREAKPDEVQRFAMQRRIFFIEGRPHLALRNDGFCETVGTLEPLIAYGRARLASLAPPLPEVLPAPVAAAIDEAPSAPLPEAMPETPPEPALAVMPEAVLEPAAPPAPKRRGRPPKLRDPAAPVAPPKRRGRPPKIRIEAAPQALPAPPATKLVALPRAFEPLTAVARVAVAPKRQSSQPTGPRWLTAGATRRGRSAVHWSTRRG